MISHEALVIIYCWNTEYGIIQQSCSSRDREMSRDSQRQKGPHCTSVKLAPHLKNFDIIIRILALPQRVDMFQKELDN